MTFIKMSLYFYSLWGEEVLRYLLEVQLTLPKSFVGCRLGSLQKRVVSNLQLFLFESV